MLLERPFEVVTPTVDGVVLSVLAGADAEFTPGEVHRLASHYSVSGIRNALSRLVGQGIVRMQRRGQAYTYVLNREHLAANAVIEVAGLRQEFLRRLTEAFEQLSVQPIYAALFGSAARGEMIAESDIDIFVVRPNELTNVEAVNWNLGVQDVEAKVQRWTGNNVSVMDWTHAQVRNASAGTGEPVLEAIRTDGIRLAGSREFWDDL